LLPAHRELSLSATIFPIDPRADNRGVVPEPRTQRGSTLIRCFLVVNGKICVRKGGFLNSRFDSALANLSSFVGSVQNLRDYNAMGTVYSGGGVEGHVGPIGLRLDVGDENVF
jgi:hypothetical protein